MGVSLLGVALFLALGLVSVVAPRGVKRGTPSPRSQAPLPPPPSLPPPAPPSVLEGEDPPLNSIMYLNQFACYFTPGCPEGCRPIDIFVTCGDASAFTSCAMANDGNVSLTCTNGATYTLTPAGCDVKVDSNAEQQYAWAHLPWEVQQVLQFEYVANHVYTAPQTITNNPPHILVSVGAAVLFLYLSLAGAQLKRLTRVLLGLAAGELMAMSLLAGFDVKLDHFVKGMPLWVFPVGVAIVTAMWKRCTAVLCGAITGFLLGSVVAAEMVAYSSEGTVSKTTFWVVVCATALGFVLAEGAREFAIYPFIAIAGAACGSVAFVHLLGPFATGNAACDTVPSAFDDHGACGAYFSETVLAACLAFVCAGNTIVAKVVAARKTRAGTPVEEDEQRPYRRRAAPRTRDGRSNGRHRERSRYGAVNEGSDFDEPFAR